MNVQSSVNGWIRLMADTAIYCKSCQGAHSRPRWLILPEFRGWVDGGVPEKGPRALGFWCGWAGPIACLQTGPAWACGRTSLAELHSRPQTRWINADCLGMTVSSGPHKKSAEREKETEAGMEKEREKKIKKKSKAARQLHRVTADPLFISSLYSSSPGFHLQQHSSVSVNVTLLTKH